MVFGYIRDLWNHLLGRNYPSPKMLEELRERPKPKKSTALIKFRGHMQIIRQPILRPVQEEEGETWVETHPSQSVCVRRLQIHEEF